MEQGIKLSTKIKWTLRDRDAAKLDIVIADAQKAREMDVDKLRSEFTKVDVKSKDVDKINRMLNGISQYFGNEESFETNQEILVVHNVFRGIVVKSWEGNDIEVSADYKHNKVVFRESVKLYTEFLIDRYN